MRNGILLTNIMSIARVMEWWSISKSCGAGSTPALACGFGHATVFPFRDPKFGLNMSSVASMSPFVIVQVFRWLIAPSINC